MGGLWKLNEEETFGPHMTLLTSRFLARGLRARRKLSPSCPSHPRAIFCMCVSMKPPCATLGFYDPSPSHGAWGWGQSRGSAADRKQKPSREAGGGEAELAAGMPLSGAATRGGFKVSCTCHRPESRTRCPPLMEVIFPLKAGGSFYL